MPSYVIGYDVQKPSTLQKVHRLLCTVGLRIGYSVFYVQLSDKQYWQYVNAITSLLDPKTDDLRCYRITPRLFRYQTGRTPLPTGVRWLF